MTERTVRTVSRDELIAFFYERDPERYDDEVTRDWAERCADEFIREFFGVDLLPVLPEIIDLSQLAIDPGGYAGLFTETRAGKTATPIVITRATEEES